MSEYRLILSIAFEVNNDNEAIDLAKSSLGAFEKNSEWLVSLTREGDRSGGNLLLPKLLGRFGEHFQGRKARLDEIS